MHKRIVLASQSPRRKHFLDQLGLEYDIVSSDIEEKFPDQGSESSSPMQVAKQLARQKAFAVGEKLAAAENNSYSEMIIIAADTIVSLKGKLYGKPVSETEAKDMLQSLSGQTHEVSTGIAILVYNF